MGTITHHIKSPAIVLTTIFIGILVLYHYYIGMQEVLKFNHFCFWLQHAPIIKPWAAILGYLVPALQLALAGMLLLRKTRRCALTVIVVQHLVYFVWVGYVFYATPYLFWPWMAINNNWFYKFLEILTVAWMAFGCLRLFIKAHKSKVRLF